MDSLKSDKLTLSYGDKPIIEELSFAIPKHKITVFVGGNGCGKSTLLKAFCRLLKPRSGQVYLDGKALNKYGAKELARQLAVLPQSPQAPEGLTVRQLIKQGRYPHQSWLQRWSEDDEYYVEQALAATDLTAFADHNIEALSGGQRQRAWIAMTLAQGTDTLILDEPTTYLDLAHQIEVLDLLHRMNREQLTTVVMVLHDLNLACRYADHIVAVKDKGVFAQGLPQTVMNAETIKSVFGLQSIVIDDPLYGTPMCVPYSQIETEGASNRHTA